MPFDLKKGMISVLFMCLLFFTACGDDDDASSDPEGTVDDDEDDDNAADDDATGDDDEDDDDNDDNDDNDTAECWDEDEDGYEDQLCGGADCNDSDPDINPDAFDVCGDDIDNNCDGIIDNPDETYVVLDEFPFGVSSGGGNPLQQLPAIGMRWIRKGIAWRDVMPEVPDPELVMEDVDEALIDDLIDSADWTAIDNHFRQYIDAGLSLWVVIGHGYTSTHSFIDGERASPYRIGADHYLAYMYWYTRAAVERYDADGYKDADGIVIKHWQIENELNQALLTAVWGWRSPGWLEALLSPWASWNFCTELLATLNRAVHESDPEAITTQNIHTDIHPNLSHLIFQPSWIEAALLWREKMDIIGFDAYPNYYVADPVYGYKIGERVEILSDVTCGKPVIAMEIGYPTGPGELGFTEENQAHYIDDAIHTALDAGVVGYFQFGLQSSDSHSVEITPEDIATMELIGPMFTHGDAMPLFIWALFNRDYVQDHFLDVVKAVEGYWGVIGPGEQQKPGYDVLVDAAAEIYGQP